MRCQTRMPGIRSLLKASLLKEPNDDDDDNLCMEFKMAHPLLAIVNAQYDVILLAYDFYPKFPSHLGWPQEAQTSIANNKQYIRV